MPDPQVELADDEPLRLRLSRRYLLKYLALTAVFVGWVVLRRTALAEDQGDSVSRFADRVLLVVGPFLFALVLGLFFFRAITIDATGLRAVLPTSLRLRVPARQVSWVAVDDAAGSLVIRISGTRGYPKTLELRVAREEWSKTALRERIQSAWSS
ncbi:MAG: hypothetical protein AAGD18_09020 [Actinomycetota bacterium]